MIDGLISRAAALEVINAVKGVVWSQSGKVLCGKMFSQIKDLPAVDAIPVVHGRWIYKERHRKSYRKYTGFDDAGETHTIMVLEESDGKEPYCSECGAQAAESFLEYCPHCGAKMDGET